MASIVEIRAATTSVACDEKGKAQHVINIHNTSGRKLRIGARVHVDPPTEERWIGGIFLPANEQQQEWDLDPDKTIQLTVPINAKGAEPGTYTFKVEVYSTEAPSEDYSTGDGIAFEVKQKAPDEKPVEKKAFPWWIIIVVVAVLVVGGLSWWAIAHFTKPKVPDVEGLTRTEAVEAITAAELVLGAVTHGESEDQPPDTVLDQKPDAGKRVTKGSRVHIVVVQADTVPTVPPVHKQGSFTVRQTWMGDLDSGVETQTGADFWFQAETATRRYLAPRNGAVFRRMGSTQADYAACKDATYSSGRIDVNLLPTGTWVCAKTNEGRISAFRITSAIGASPGRMSISFTTWQKPLTVRPVRPILEVQPLRVDPQ